MLVALRFIHRIFSPTIQHRSSSRPPSCHRNQTYLSYLSKPLPSSMNLSNIFAAVILHGKHQLCTIFAQAAQQARPKLAPNAARWILPCSQSHCALPCPCVAHLSTFYSTGWFVASAASTDGSGSFLPKHLGSRHIKQVSGQARAERDVVQIKREPAAVPFWAVSPVSEGTTALYSKPLLHKMIFSAFYDVILISFIFCLDSPFASPFASGHAPPPLLGPDHPGAV